MRTFVTCAALTALLAATGCSEHEILPVGPGNEGNGEVATLGISTGVKTTSKAIVEGAMLSYKVADYVNQPGLGIVMLNSDGSGFYGAKPADQELEKNHIWFMGDQNGENWKSISALGSSFGGATTKGFTLLDAVGTVYAYYPKAADEKLSGETVDDLALTVPLQTAGTITFDDKVTNADMKFSGSWSKNSTALIKAIISYPDETDYLYAYNTERYVNSGRVGTGEPQGNGDDINPGREIALTMNHALSMVSFRVYNDGSLAGDGKLTKVTIGNVTDKEAFMTGTSVMNLGTGAITTSGNATADKITRTIVNYTIPCQIASGETETMFKFIPAGTGTSAVTGPKVARKMSMLVYPIDEIPEGELEVVFTIDGKEYPVTLPNTDVSSWVAGENQLYTVCASERKLTITSVEVTEWADGTGGDIEL